MASLEDLERFEDELEQKEGEVDEANERLEEVNDRIAAIERAISSLGDDRELQSSIERNNLIDAEAQQLEIETRRENLTAEIKEVEVELNELDEVNEQSAQTIAELASMGEEVSEAEGLIEERKRAIERSRMLAQQLHDRLRA